MTIPRRTIKELKVRLKLEKSLKEIYVEGNFDRDVLRWVLNHLELSDVQVYPIATVEIPIENVNELGLTSGERQRLIALANELVNEVDLHEQIALVIDSDLDFLIGDSNYAPTLIPTVGTSLEMILWRNEVLIKFFVMVLGSNDAELHVEQLREYIEPIVAEVFLFRGAKRLLGKDWKLVDIKDTFDKVNQFSFDDYCSKVAAKNSAHKEMSEVLPAALEIVKERSLNLDSTQLMHSHDLMSAMAKKLHIDGFRQGCLKDFNELTRHLMSTLEWSFVKDDPTIQLVYSKFK